MCFVNQVGKDIRQRVGNKFCNIVYLQMKLFSILIGLLVQKKFNQIQSLKNFFMRNQLKKCFQYFKRKLVVYFQPMIHFCGLNN